MCGMWGICQVTLFSRRFVPKGFKIVEGEERTLGHLFDDDKRLAEVRKRWDKTFEDKTALEYCMKEKIEQQ